MIQTLLETLNQDPFFSGGLSLMVVGTAVALLRKGVRAALDVPPAAAVDRGRDPRPGSGVPLAPGRLVAQPYAGGRAD